MLFNRKKNKKKCQINYLIPIIYLPIIYLNIPTIYLNTRICNNLGKEETNDLSMQKSSDL